MSKTLEEHIIDEIIAKGNIYGQVASLIKNDKRKVEGFILECFEQTHTPGFKEAYSKELIDLIIKYKYKT